MSQNLLSNETIKKLRGNYDDFNINEYYEGITGIDMWGEIKDPKKRLDYLNDMMSYCQEELDNLKSKYPELF